MTWVMIVVAWVTASNMGGGYAVSSVPGFSSQQTCESAAAIVRQGPNAKPREGLAVYCSMQ